jgi:hypothetical protein
VRQLGRGDAVRKVAWTTWLIGLVDARMLNAEKKMKTSKEQVGIRGQADVGSSNVMRHRNRTPRRCFSKLRLPRERNLPDGGTAIPSAGGEDDNVDERTFKNEFLMAYTAHHSGDLLLDRLNLTFLAQ